MHIGATWRIRQPSLCGGDAALRQIILATCSHYGETVTLCVVGGRRVSRADDGICRRMYTSNKRRRTDMLLGAPAPPPLAPAPPADGQRPPADCADPRAELRRLALDVEPVVLPPAFPTSAAAAAPAAEPPPPVIGYQPTYRAVLAKRGYLVRNTLGSGSYSKVRSTPLPQCSQWRIQDMGRGGGRQGVWGWKCPLGSRSKAPV